MDIHVSLDKTMRLSSDRSEIWDHSYKDYTSVRIGQISFFQRQSHRKGLGGRLSADERKVDSLANSEKPIRFAVTWKRILTFASHSEEILAHSYRTILCIPELLAAPETTSAAGMAITQAYEKNLFAQAEFAGIQSAILSTPRSAVASMFRDPPRFVMLYCARIPVDQLELEARTALNKDKARLSRARVERLLSDGFRALWTR